ncbi:hypothetical protein [Bradyrhizobium sp. USDA 4473]
MANSGRCISTAAKIACSRRTWRHGSEAGKPQRGASAMNANDMSIIALNAGVKKSALADIATQFSDDGGASLAEWLESKRAEKAHWFEPPAGNGDDAALYSLSAQSDLVKSLGLQEAEAHMIRLGAKLGSVKPRPAEEIDEKGANNPWSTRYRGKDAERRRIEIIRTLGSAKAAALARAAGTDLAGRLLAKR